MVKSFPVHLSIVHISFVRAGNSVVVGEERGVGGGIGPSSDSVITRTDYYLTVAGLRAQWRRPARSVTRVSPEKLLGHVRGNDLRAGARGFSWRYYVYTRIHTHARGARDSNANFERRSGPRGYVGATWIVFRDRRLVQELYRLSFSFFSSSTDLSRLRLRSSSLFLAGVGERSFFSDPGLLYGDDEMATRVEFPIVRVA